MKCIVATVVRYHTGLAQRCTASLHSQIKNFIYPRCAMRNVMSLRIRLALIFILLRSISFGQDSIPLFTDVTVGERSLYIWFSEDFLPDSSDEYYNHEYAYDIQIPVVHVKGNPAIDRKSVV